MFDESHNHKCPECACVWHHDPKSIPDVDGAHTQAHSCPECGTQQYLKLTREPGVPKYCSNGARCIKLDGSGEVCAVAPIKPESETQQSAGRQRSTAILELFSALFQDFERDTQHGLDRY